MVTQSVKTKPATTDLWRLVWEMKSNCIVMLTKVFDFMRVSVRTVIGHIWAQVMCLQYWPVQRLAYGDIEVETLSTRTYCYFVIRTLRIHHNGQVHPVYICHTPMCSRASSRIFTLPSGSSTHSRTYRRSSSSGDASRSTRASIPARARLWCVVRSGEHWNVWHV